MLITAAKIVTATAIDLLEYCLLINAIAATIRAAADSINCIEAGNKPPKTPRISDIFKGVWLYTSQNADCIRL